MNGRPVLSCSILTSECDGAVIETVEGIAAAGHPLIEAYIMNWTTQCGYCTPGFVVTAKALLDHNPDPTEDEIKEALSGNLCRCGTYATHVKAVQQAARKLRGKNNMAEEFIESKPWLWRPPKEHGYIGRRGLRPKKP
jgi:aerobic-type carbon monoxide dehydrogenase small subunit (CoxS/CutS family)